MNSTDLRELGEKLQKLLNQAFLRALNLNDDGHWHFVVDHADDRLAEDLLAEFRNLAEQAGIAAGAPDRANAVDFWLNLLVEGERRRELKRPAFLSSKYCFAMANDALVVERDEKQSASVDGRVERGLSVQMPTPVPSIPSRVSIGLAAEFMPEANALSSPMHDEKPVEVPCNRADLRSAVSPASEDTESDMPIDQRKAARRRLREAYIGECKVHGVKVTDEMLARAANPATPGNKGWNNRTQIQKWLACDPKYDGPPDTLIRKVFVQKPHLKASCLKETRS